MVRWGAVAEGRWIRTDDALLRPVRLGDRRLMLKLADPDGDETGAPDWLRALDGRGAVRLVAEDGPVILIERVTPTGPGLAAMALGGQDEAALGIMVDLTLGAQSALRGADLPRLIPLDRRVAFVGALDRAGLPGDLAAALAWAPGFLAEMTADRTGWTALHGDMHHLNALHDSDRGWLMIDPKGLLGPPPCDFANMLLNPHPHAGLTHDPARMARQAGLVAERLGLRPAEMLAWVTVQGLLGAAWSAGDADWPYWLAGARVAARLGGLSLP
jgi:streptomycin 6-kinase